MFNITFLACQGKFTDLTFKRFDLLAGMLQLDTQRAKLTHFSHVHRILRRNIIIIIIIILQSFKLLVQLFNFNILGSKIALALFE